MPLLRIDVVEGRSTDQIKAVLNAAHSALVAAFQIPERDRYQVIQEHPPSRLVVEDTGLGIEHHLLCESLRKECGIEPSDVVVSIVTNSDEDWSFGNGRAQFLTGELEASSSEGSRARSIPIRG
jgi:phenylpyruvate tautomerase PptA (4-oxalocrotonate tautomerase family)